MIYLDYAASSPVHREVLHLMSEYFRDCFANPSSSHRLGRESAKMIENARNSILKISGINNKFNLIFTSSATESNNMAVFGLPSGSGVLYSEADHPSVVKAVKNLPSTIKKIRLPLKAGGLIDLEKLRPVDLKNAGLAVLTYVNNQSGIINDIGAVSQRIKDLSPDISIHVDAVQGYAKIPAGFGDWNVETISISAHKIGGPKGAAGLFISNKTLIRPLMYGGGQEFDLRPSTGSVPLILGFKKAVEIMFENIDINLLHVSEINRKLRIKLKENFSNIIFPFNEDACSPYILTFILKGLPGDMLVRHLEEKDIFISTSSACSSKSEKKNESFSAMLIPTELQNSVLRVSFSKGTSSVELDEFISTLKEITNELSSLL